MSVSCQSLFVFCFFLSGFYLRFVITEHQPSFLFWSWRYLAGTVTSAHLSILLSTQHGLHIYRILVSLCPDNEFVLSWIAAPSHSYFRGYEALLFLHVFPFDSVLFLIFSSVFSLGLPCFSSSGWCFFSLCSGAETDSNRILRSSISYATEINVKQRKWLNNVVCVCRCVTYPPVCLVHACLCV